jgi:hypothetical protein
MLTRYEREKFLRKLQNPLSFQSILKDSSFNIDFTNFDSEVRIESIDDFEHKTNININVFSLEQEKFPLRITKKIFIPTPHKSCSAALQCPRYVSLWSSLVFIPISPKKGTSQKTVLSTLP